MLGNWSFGDYFKNEAIEWAWELLTKVWSLDKTACTSPSSRAIGPASRATTRRPSSGTKIADLDPTTHPLLGNKDNFWEMGDTGPCGPCSEIHIDRTPDKSGGKVVGGENPRSSRFWNLVFIQFNRDADGKLDAAARQARGHRHGLRAHLPDPAGQDGQLRHRPVGAVFRRHRRCLAARSTTGIFPSSDVGGGSATRMNRQLQTDIAFRAIADHLRMATFSITDGAVPCNKKRGAVLRWVIRRAVRFGYQVLEIREPFLHKLVPLVTTRWARLSRNSRRIPQRTASILKEEEEAFLSVIDRGLRVFEDAADRPPRRGRARSSSARTSSTCTPRWVSRPT